MENDSETRRSPGRPRRFSEALLEELDLRYPHGSGWVRPRSHRGRQNFAYAFGALAYLADWFEEAPELKWLHEPQPRLSILSELGRIQNPEVRLVVALWVAGRKPTAREATHEIRTIRKAIGAGGIDQLNELASKV